MKKILQVKGVMSLVLILTMLFITVLPLNAATVNVSRGATPTYVDYGVQGAGTNNAIWGNEIGAIRSTTFYAKVYINDNSGQFASNSVTYSYYSMVNSNNASIKSVSVDNSSLSNNDRTLTVTYKVAMNLYTTYPDGSKTYATGADTYYVQVVYTP
ncbi:MAG: hypothetical protein ACYDG2_11605 [Ruminiclostridium sp.]